MRTGQLITFTLNVKNPYSIELYAFSNGFRVYSPDYATWTTTTPDTVTNGWLNYFDNAFIRSYSITGSDADTVGFGFFSFFGPGLPYDFDSETWTITIGPIPESMAGKTICIDSCFFQPAGDWVWTDVNSVNYTPDWDGEHCYEIANLSEISYSGNLYYTNPAPPFDTTAQMLSDVVIEMWDKDDISDDDLLAIDTTDNNGHFQLGPVDNHDDIWQTQDVYFRYLALNKNAIVKDSQYGDTCKYVTAYEQDVEDGEYSIAPVIPLDSSWSFYWAMLISDIHDKWESASLVDLDKLGILPTFTSSTHFDTLAGCIWIIMDTLNPLFGYPDTYDGDIIIHEYGHYAEWSSWFCDKSDTSSHHFYYKTNDSVAACEGFAHFFSSFMRLDPVAIDYAGDFTQWESYNIETGRVYNWLDGYILNFNELGNTCEGSVAGILWDIYDNADDDQSTFPPMDTCTYLNDTGDGIGDELYMNSGEILSTFLNRFVDGHHPDRIGEFLEAWNHSPSFGYSAELRNIWNEHGILTCGDADASGTITIADAVYLINYIFKSGSPPSPLESGDANCDLSVNLGDVVYLIQYIFNYGPPPCCY